ncbi:hypothetical protein H310_04666 [Aphanomyces invadans]|uniref:Fibronectin type III-like domain-containing protein n=1 Tax=Aphanomyces invadans TaxID=157072 RepID=A0A024UDB3_9STRA|nr:hypothetical protein H310_04666 [Aphanomyces invadans]ETW04381.1 hypothetical protein H310_04666 [Aphanomyces invadans]|eukprot:XP_008867337.1 hypothetical protein H310_04666 [Aphanomyces invadans]
MGAAWVSALQLISLHYATAASMRICDRDVQKMLPFCNPSLSLDERVEDLVARIPEAAVPGLLGDNATFISIPGALDLPSYGWWSEGLHGVGISPSVRFTAPTPVATSYPQILNLASSFNRDLFAAVGAAISTEARAFHSVGHGGLTYWAPNINLYRDPRWGRGQETPGEDPFLTAEYAVAFVSGMQNRPNATSPWNASFLHVSACCKHFSGYSQEVPRHSLDAIVTAQDLEDTYLVAFEACVSRGGASCVMCSYNAVNGVPSCADRHFLTHVVRNRWNFDGYIISDCGAVYDVLWHHRYTHTAAETCAATLEAGMDLNCGDFVQLNLPHAIDHVDKAAWKRALRNLFRTQMRLGLFEATATAPFRDSSPADIDTPAHRQLALDAATQSIVLLKNVGKTLPLDKDAVDAGNRLALLGPHVHATTAQLGSYAGVPPFIVSPFEGVTATHVPSSFVDVHAACTVGGEELAEGAIAIAAKAAHVVLVVGMDQSIESEGIDRATLEWPGRQRELIARVAAVAMRPIVLVLVSGGPVDLAEFEVHSNVGAIVYAGYLGQSGGTAIAQVLFGDVNPSGRLAHTFYRASFTSEVSISDMHMRPHSTSLGRTHRFYMGAPVYPFGHGLSYTVFHYSITCDECDGTGAVRLRVTVENVGELVGDVSLLCFAAPPRAGTMGRPLQTLVGFERVNGLRPGDDHTWQFALDPATVFMLASKDGVKHLVPGAWTFHVGDASVTVDVHGDVKKSAAKRSTNSNRSRVWSSEPDEGQEDST